MFCFLCKIKNVASFDFFCLRVGHCTGSGVIMLHLTFWGSANFCFREIFATADPILRRLEMGVVSLMGVSPLECKESVSTLQNKNLKEHCTWIIYYEICAMSIICLTEPTKNALFRLSSHLNI